MAYNFCVVQRLSDGKYQTRTGGWDTLDFTSNYSNARFYYSDADDVSQYISGYPGGDYRVVEYWMPGKPSGNRPKSNATILNNFMGQLYSANSVTIDSVSTKYGFDRCRVQTVDDYNGFLGDWNIAGGRNGWLIFTTEQVEPFGIQGVIPAAEIRGMVSDYTGRDYWAMSIRSTNSSPGSSGYRRIVYNGGFSEAPFSGLDVPYVFVA
jgi:hypothetical protein